MNPAAAEYREIERRFLVQDVPEEITAAHEPHRIEQGYLTVHPVAVRLRREGDDQFFLTTKCGPLGNREEREITLTRGQFETLWPLTAGRRIRKTRTRIPCGAGLIELDAFAGKHTGLHIAEIEFPNPEAAAAFVPPGWFGEEITRRPEYSNASLATES